MRYFTNDFFESITNGEEGKKLYMHQWSEYWRNFDSCSHRLPKSFVAYYKKHGFHDDVLVKLEMIKRTTKTELPPAGSRWVRSAAGSRLKFTKGMFQITCK